MNRIKRMVRRHVGMTPSRNAKLSRGTLFCGIGLAILLASLSSGIMPAGALDPGALPKGGQIVSGQGSISTSGKQMTIIEKQNRMITNWDSFNIGANASVTFIQPGSSSIALNRILDQNPSQIFGSLKSNGEVFLLNPSGIVFGPTASVDVGGLVASSLNLSNADFLLGRYRFTPVGTAGPIVNQGTINAANYGVVALIAPQVTNQGTISANGGSVALAAGDRVLLDFAGDGLIKVSVDQAALNSAVENKTAVKGDAGQVLMTPKTAGELVATAVNNTGVIEADSISEKNGVIVLDGGSKGTVSNSGTISAEGHNAGETGGAITLTGEKVGLFSGSDIDASGYSGGGKVNVGGGAHGEDSNIRNAEAVYMDSNSRIAADATQKGNGGDVVLWSESYTNFRGSISARGGAPGGNGGWVETSSKKVLDAFGSVTTSASKGNAGTWLLDPSDIFIRTDASGSLKNGVYDPTSAMGDITPSTIVKGLKNGNVTIETTGGSGGVGEIYLDNSIITNGNLGGTRTLTLKADGDIVFTSNQGINATVSNSSPLNVVLWSNANAANSGGSIVMNPGSYIKSNGGNITLGGGTDINTGYAQGRDFALYDFSNGITLFGAQLVSGGGNITLRGRGALYGGTWDNGTSGAVGVLLGVDDSTHDTIIDSGSGKVSIAGVGKSTSGDIGDGVALVATPALGTTTVTISSANNSTSAITINGNAAASSSWITCGIELDTGATIQATNAGGIQLTGLAGSGNSESAGLLFSQDSYVLANKGPISLTGTAGSSSTSVSNFIYSAHFGQAPGTSVTSSSSDITVTGDTLTMHAPVVMTSGIVTIQPKTPSTTIGVGNGSGTLHVGGGSQWLATGSFAGGIVLGRSDGTGAITFGTGDSMVYTDLTVLNTGVGSGGITLNGSLTADGNITFATAGKFTNNFGANALTANGGRWLVYSANPSLDTPDGLLPGFIQYNAPYSKSPLGTGNGFLYSLAPVVDVSLTGTVSKTYDGTTVAPLDQANYHYTGAQSGDTLYFGQSAYGYDDKNVGTGKLVSVSGLDVVSAREGSIPVYGYQVGSSSISANIGTITPASLTISGATAANKVYDATTAATISGETLIGVLGDDNVTVSGSGYFANKNVGTGKAVTADLFLSGADAGNYKITQPTGLYASITPASLMISAVSDTKVYDSTTKSDAIPSVSGLKGSDTVTDRSEVFDSPDVGSRTLWVNSYTVNDGNNGHNYNVTTTTAPGVITSQNPIVEPPVTTGSKIQAGLASTQATDNGTGSILGNPSPASPESGPGEAQSPPAPARKSGEASTGPSSPGVTASQYSQQGAEYQKAGDFASAAVSFREASDMLLQSASVSQAREAIELMKMAELQDYFHDAGITGDQEHKTRLKDLPKDTAVVYTMILPQRLDLILGMRSGIRKFSVPIEAATLSQEVNALRSSLQRRSRWDYSAEARKLYNLIMKPLELELNANEINTVIFVPDGVLRTVPFAALYDGSRFLIEKYAVVVSPGLNFTDPRLIQRKDTRVLSAGLTESVQGFTPLCNVGGELDGIQGLYRADRLQNTSFVEGKVRENLKDNPYSIVHIATHGSFARNASDSFLLTWDSRIDMNGLDHLVKQSVSSKNKVELLSLSACETAAGDDRAALGLAGVALKAGTRSALATLWSVNDQASSELVLEFYRQLKNPGVTKAEALQAAQLMLLDDPRYRHPYYWSPFLLIGNWL